MTFGVGHRHPNEYVKKDLEYGPIWSILADIKSGTGLGLTLANLGTFDGGNNHPAFLHGAPVKRDVSQLATKGILP